MKLFFATTDWKSLALMGVLLIFFIGIIVYSSYSNRKKQAQATAMNKSLKVGDLVKTIGGIMGTIVEIDEEMGTIEVSTGSGSIVFDRSAIYPLSFFGPNPALLTNTEEVEELQTEEEKDEIEKIEE